jgi:hypothetical protein
MKAQNRIVLLTATAIMAMFVTQAGAQYRAVGDDGIAASPKVRQALDERALSTAKRKVAVIACCGQATACKAKTAATKASGQCCERKSKQPQAAPIK